MWGLDTPTSIKEPLAAETEIEHDGETLEEKDIHDERDDENRNDEKMEGMKDFKNSRQCITRWR